MTRGLVKRKTSPPHRISLTHGQEGVPKILRENTEQFFARATRRKSTIVSARKSAMGQSFQQSSSIQPPPPLPPPQQQQQPSKKKENTEAKYIEKPPQTTSIARPSVPSVVLPPIQTEKNQRQKSISSASVRIHQQTLQASPCESSEFTTPILETPRPTVVKRQLRRGGPVDPDLFRKAYDRALSVARSRLLFHDPYSFAQAGSTHGVLYSYYDHTPMCIFSHGTDCTHQQDRTNTQENRSQTENFRKRIFRDVVVEKYIE